MEASRFIWLANVMANWPDVLSPKLVTLLGDCHMINHLDSQDWSEVRAFQSRRLSELLSHAAKHSEWWRDRLSMDKDSRKLTFSHLPLMTRADLRESIRLAGGALPVPVQHGVVHKAATSGSSGVPLNFYYSDLVGRLNGAHSWLDRQRRGIDSRQRIVRFSVHLEPHEGTHVMGDESPLLARSAEYQRRAQQFTIAEHAQWIKDIAPNYIVAHPTILSGIMDELEQDPEAPKVELLLTYAETVTPQFRQRAKMILGAETADRYSSQELGPLAFQCPKSEAHYHLASTNVRLEVLDESGQPCPWGAIGRVHATGLHTFANPIVRYELGDLAAMAPECVCGHPHPVLHQLLGRERFLLKMLDGSRRYVNFGARHWLRVAPLDEARIVQYQRDLITAEYVMERELTSQEHQAFTQLLRDEISPDVTYAIVRKQHIDWGPSYKRQDIISLV